MDAVINCILIVGNILTVMNTKFLNRVERNTVTWPEHLEDLVGVRVA